MERFFLTWKIDHDDVDKDIKSYLLEQGISRRSLTAIKFSGGEILVNGVERTVRYRLKNADILKVLFPPEEKNEQMIGESLPLSIVYEDRDLLIVNKLPYMNTIPSRDHPHGSLANGLVHYYEQSHISSAVHIVTRLDRNTSGLVLIAKHRHAHHQFGLMQEQAKIEKYYDAFVAGRLESASGKIDAPIGRKPDSIIEREVRSDGQTAITFYQMIHQYDHFAHVRLKLETGRTHQIRVHMAFIGHPLIGDELYGGDQKLIARQALHCSNLSFDHPFIRKKMNISAQLPHDMQQLLDNTEN